MAELIRTNDVAVISVAEGVLSAAGIPYEVADRNMSILEGSVGAIQMRILVPEEFEDLARQMLLDVDLGDWLRR